MSFEYLAARQQLHRRCVSIMLNLNDLVRQARSGDPSAEERLFEHLTVSLRLIAQHRVWDEEAALEVTQEALTTIAQKYRSIEFKRSFAGWARQVLVNKIFDYVKAKKSLDSRMQAISDSASPSAWTPDPTLQSRLVECLRKISATHRQHARIINLHYQGFSTTEICERLDLTPNNLYVSLSRARSMLESCLESGEPRK